MPRTHRAVSDGQYLVLNGHEYPLIYLRGGEVVAYSYTPEPGFVAGTGLRQGKFEYHPEPGEALPCVEYRSTAVYRGLELEAEATGNGKFRVGVDTAKASPTVTEDQARAAGLEFSWPGDWYKIVDLDDPHLVVTTTRTPIRPPWLPGEDSQ